MKLILGLLLCLSLSQGVFAEEKTIESYDIPSFPRFGSPEEEFDFKELLRLQNTRTQAQCDEAQSEADVTLGALFGAPKGPLSAAEVKTMEKKMAWLTVRTGATILYYKTKFSRPRPYETYAFIKPCIDLEGSKAYPSGHTTIARVYARILSVSYPERKAQFMKRADQVAFNRVLGGVHHPSDIVAGKKLGDAIADDYLDIDDFRYELEASR